MKELFYRVIWHGFYKGEILSGFYNGVFYR